MITPLAVFLDQCPCPKCEEPSPDAFVLLPTSVELADAVCCNCGLLVRIEIMSRISYKQAPELIELSPRRRSMARIAAGKFTDIIVIQRSELGDDAPTDQDYWLINGSDLKSEMFESRDSFVSLFDFEVIGMERFRLLLPTSVRPKRIFRAFPTPSNHRDAEGETSGSTPMGLAEVAIYLGRSLQSVYALQKRGKLPKPDVELASTKIWYPATIDAWKSSKI